MKGTLLLVALLFVRLLAISQAECRFSSYRDQMLQTVAGLKARVEAIESFTAAQLLRKSTQINDNLPALGAPQIITIPVVIHIVYHNSQQNISDAQVHSQIDLLNQDYSRQNADTVHTPASFQQFAANCGFQFELAKVDQSGYATSGIIRKYSSILAFSIDDQIKSSAAGGNDGWDPDNYLNIWVGNLSSGILGYSSVVGGPREKDGVVVLFTAFGTIGTATAPFGRGRTTTHEIGHWLNLIHTWGDAYCGDDHVADTPPQQGPDRGCPTGTPISCNNGPNGNMFMNYMDFSNDDCMNLFTYGQRDRMLTLFAPGGPRYKLLSANSLSAVPKPSPQDVSKNLGDGIPNFNLFPNPAFQNVSLEIGDSTFLGATVEIYNAVGQKLFIFRQFQTEQQLNISSLKAGIYYIQLNNGKSRMLGKLVKM